MVSAVLAQHAAEPAAASAGKAGPTGDGSTPEFGTLLGALLAHSRAHGTAGAQAAAAAPTTTDAPGASPLPDGLVEALAQALGGGSEADGSSPLPDGLVEELAQALGGDDPLASALAVLAAYEEHPAAGPLAGLVTELLSGAEDGSEGRGGQGRRVPYLVAVAAAVSEVLNSDVSEASAAARASGDTNDGDVSGTAPAGQAAASKARGLPSALWSAAAEHSNLDPADLRALAARLPQAQAAASGEGTATTAAQAPQGRATDSGVWPTPGAGRGSETLPLHATNDHVGDRAANTTEASQRSQSALFDLAAAARPTGATPTGEVGRAAATLPTRILEAVEALRAGPPPERVTIDLSELTRSDDPLKITVTMRGGNVSLVAANPQSAALLAMWNDDIASALAQRGLDLSTAGKQDDDQAEQPGTRPDDEQTPPDEAGLAAAHSHALTDPDDRSVWL